MRIVNVSLNVITNKLVKTQLSKSRFPQTRSTRLETNDQRNDFIAKPDINVSGIVSSILLGLLLPHPPPLSQSLVRSMEIFGKRKSADAYRKTLLAGRKKRRHVVPAQKTGKLSGTKLDSPRNSPTSIDPPTF